MAYSLYRQTKKYRRSFPIFFEKNNEIFEIVGAKMKFDKLMIRIQSNRTKAVLTVSESTLNNEYTKIF